MNLLVVEKEKAPAAVTHHEGSILSRDRYENIIAQSDVDERT
jgi:hypothetical protein